MSEEKHFKKTKYVFLNVWLGWQDSNLRVRESKSRALPLGDTPVKVNGAGDKFRTCYLQSHNLALYRLSYARHMLVRLERFEPPTHGLEGRCSILLSYRRVSHRFAVRFALKALERVMGIGPTQPAWKASVLPLNYTRITYKVRTTQCNENYNKSKFCCQLILKLITKNIKIAYG